jgi:hypothetical protein
VITPEVAQAYRRDGAVVLRGVLRPHELRRLAEGIEVRQRAAISDSPLAALCLLAGFATKSTPFSGHTRAHLHTWIYIIEEVVPPSAQPSRAWCAGGRGERR